MQADKGVPPGDYVGDGGDKAHQVACPSGVRHIQLIDIIHCTVYDTVLYIIKHGYKTKDSNKNSI